MNEELANCWCGGKAAWKHGGNSLTPRCQKCGKEGLQVSFREWRLARDRWNNSNAGGPSAGKPR